MNKLFQYINKTLFLNHVCEFSHDIKEVIKFLRFYSLMMYFFIFLIGWGSLGGNKVDFCSILATS